MDKHDRPYKCSEPGCSKIQGFTYSGGLLRHMREVHKNTQAKKADDLICPFVDCTRHSAAQGFTRRENLNEHIRRRHRKGEEVAPEVIFTTPEGIVEPPRKRKRNSDDGDIGGIGQDEIDLLREEVKRLRADNLDKDKRLRNLEAYVNSIQQQQMHQMDMQNELQMQMHMPGGPIDGDTKPDTNVNADGIADPDAHVWGPSN